jgi:beta-lactamase class A
MIERFRLLIVAVGFVLLAFGAGFWAGGAALDRREAESSRLRLSGKLTSPLLECDEANFRYIGIRPLEDGVRGYVEQLARDKKIEDISVYFRDLNNGPWFGVNERENFSPASLLKVPIMMAYLRQESVSPGALERRVAVAAVDPQLEERQNFLPVEKLEPGREYTVSELIRRMIEYSDNAAASVLLSNIDGAVLQATFSDLGLVAPDVEHTKEDFMTVRRVRLVFQDPVQCIVFKPSAFRAGASIPHGKQVYGWHCGRRSLGYGRGTQVR